jgi:hypothetical protein
MMPAGRCTGPADNDESSELTHPGRISPRVRVLDGMQAGVAYGGGHGPCCRSSRDNS